MPLQYNIVSPGAAPAGALNLSSLLLGGVSIGADTSGAFAVTALGVAICREDGACVVFDPNRDRVIDATSLVLTGINPWVVRIPVPSSWVRRGDVMVVSDEPFSALIALVCEEGRPVVAIDPLTDQIVQFSPPLNLFFNITVLAVSPFQFFEF